MNTHGRSKWVCASIFIAVVQTSAQLASAQSTRSFTYQGQLVLSGSPVTGVCDFEFRLFDADSDGIQIGATQSAPQRSVTNGLFTVTLVAGTAFTGANRWLEIAVRCPDGSGPYTTLSPRQLLTAAPYAVYAPEAGSVPWSGLTDVPAGFADGTDDGSTYSAGTGLMLNGNQFNLVTAYQLPQGCNNQQVPRWTGASWLCGNYNAGLGLLQADMLFYVNFPPAGGSNGAATTVARGDHTHYGATWSGAAMRGLSVLTSDASGGGTAALYGRQGTGAGFTPAVAAGVWGDSNVYPGVLGSSASGDGVTGLSATGTGVYGQVSAGTGVTEGVAGVSYSFEGRGVAAVNLSSGTGLYARSVYGNPIEAYGTSTSNRRFYVSNSGSVFADGSYNCGLSSGCLNTGSGADVAERIDTHEALQPGDLVEIDPDHPGRFRLARERFSRRVAGVVSSSPAITMNNNDLADNESGLRTDNRPLLALVGQIPVKATVENGPIRPGDMLVASSTAGYAMHAGEAPGVGTVIGKSLGALDQGTGVLPMLVMLQ